MQRCCSGNKTAQCGDTKHQGTSAGSSTGYPQSPSGWGLSPEGTRDKVLPQEPPHQCRMLLKGGQHLPSVLQPPHVRQVTGFVSIKDGNNKTKANSSLEEMHTEAPGCVMAHFSRIPSIKQQFPSQSWLGCVYIFLDYISHLGPSSAATKSVSMSQIRSKLGLAEK